MSNPGTDSFRNVLKYGGQDYSFAPRYLRGRDPLSPTNASTDIKPKEQQGYYPLGSIWNNSNNSNVWILSRIVNNLANWILITTGGSGPLLMVTVPFGVSPIVPDTTGTINFTSSLGTVVITGSSANPNNHTINFDITGGGLATERFQTDDALFETPSGSPPTIVVHGANGLTTSQGASNQVNVNLPTSTQGTVLTGVGANAPVFSTTVTGDGLFTFANFSASTARKLSSRNTDTNAAATASVQAAVVNTSAADSYFEWALEATRHYSLGIDNSDSSSFKLTTLSNVVTPSTGTILSKMTSNGERTLPKQPCFLVGGTSTINLTGDGTVATITFGTTITDQGSNFSGTTFTAPVTGNYLFTTIMTVSNLTAANTDMIVNIVTTARSYQVSSISPGKTFETNSGATTLAVCGSVIAPMTAGNTAQITLNVTGGAKDIGIIGTTQTINFSGALIC